ncbi:HK97 gp10 family phage protein [Pseudomonas putida]|uniref:HK97 gp10 family phage protein n=1 Tax=Pseudomonas putida TaxID=303 RepID=A0AAP9N155_PSEPU|nr:hypothetical protein [Pseudomonas putida]MDD2005145.1 HK97 gp10 family phage protein [Pseudomonas putida]QJQ11313.1 HK97 gp10 family phage protein [Pseudomonas putida]
MAGWSIPPTAFADQIESDLVKQARIIAMALLGEIVLRSPVDTGRFRGNTMVSIGVPVFATTDNVDKDGAATIAAGQAVLLGLKPYTRIFLQNNLVYAEKLENGHSKKAPNGVFGISFTGVAAAYGS